MGVNYNPSIVTSGLVLHLDAANTKSYPGSGTTWTDVSGNGNTGTLTNGPTFSTSNNGVIVFDGVNDYIATPMVISSRPFTFNAWFYFNSLTGWQTLIGQDTSQAIAYGAIYFQKTNNSGTPSPRANNTFGLAFFTASNAQINCYDSTVVQVSTWYNYCASVTTTDITLYRNGSQVNNVSNSEALAAPNGTAIVGAAYNDTTRTDYVKMNLSVVSVYNRAISESEVMQNYNAMRGRFGV